MNHIQRAAMFHVEHRADLLGFLPAAATAGRSAIQAAALSVVYGAQ